MGEAHVREAEGPSQFSHPKFMNWIEVAVHQGHSEGFDAVLSELVQAREERVFLYFPIYFTIGEDALINLEHRTVQGHEARTGRKDLEDPTPTLVTNSQQVGEATGNNQRGPCSFTREERVGCNRRTHPQGIKGGPRSQLFEQVQSRPLAAVHSQDLAMVPFSAGTRSDQVGKRPASIHSDMPTTTHPDNLLEEF